MFKSNFLVQDFRAVLSMLHLFSTSDFRLLLLPVPSRLCVHKLSFLRRRTVSVTTPPLLAAPPEPSRLRARTSSRCCGGVARCPSPPRRRLLLLPCPLGCVRSQALVFAAASHGPSPTAPPSLAAPPEPSRLLALTSSCFRGDVARCPCWLRACVRFFSSGGIARCVSPPRHRLLPPL